MRPAVFIVTLKTLLQIVLAWRQPCINWNPNYPVRVRVRVMVFNTIFNNISVISWRNCLTVTLICGQVQPFIFSSVYSLISVFNLNRISYRRILSSNPAHGKVYSIQHYVIKFVSDLQNILSMYCCFGRFQSLGYYYCKIALIYFQYDPAMFTNMFFFIFIKWFSTIQTKSIWIR
jgi:hypothetical protein